MAWSLSGQLIESCSCNVLCPCWFGAQDLMLMDRGWCASTLLFRIRGGRSDDVDLSGRAVLVALDFPGPTLFDGKGTARLHIDDGASDAQRKALDAIFTGKKGGPMEIIGGLISNWLPAKSSRIEVREEGDRLTAIVDGSGQVESRLLKDEAGRPMNVTNAGFATVLNFDGLRFDVAPSATRWSDPDLPHQFETRSGARATWTWSGS